MTIVHGVHEFRVCIIEIHRLPAVGVAVSATPSELVNLITVEVKMLIHLFVSVSQIVEPFLIAWVEQVDIAFPTAGQPMSVLIAVVWVVV